MVFALETDGAQGVTGGLGRPTTALCRRLYEARAISF
jgi:hypothetical protein